MTDTQQIIDHWNSKSGKWQKCREITPSISRWINNALKEYSVETLKTAINNYHFVLNSRDCKWTRKWGLLLFFSIQRPDSKGREFANHQLVRFVPDEFDVYDYLTPEAKHKKNQNKPQTTQVINPLSFEEKRKMAIEAGLKVK